MRLFVNKRIKKGRQKFLTEQKDRERTRYAQAVGQHCGEIDSLLDLPFWMPSSTFDFRGRQIWR